VRPLNTQECPFVHAILLSAATQREAITQTEAVKTCCDTSWQRPTIASSTLQNHTLSPTRFSPRTIHLTFPCAPANAFYIIPFLLPSVKQTHPLQELSHHNCSVAPQNAKKSSLSARAREKTMMTMDTGTMYRVTCQ